MATQIKVEELEGCKSYLGWLREKSDVSGELSRVLFETDFEWSVDEDEIRARDALELRKIYADEVGSLEKKSKRDIDRIWKSIYGKCCIFELLISMAKHIDQMVNEGEEGSMIPIFMKIFLANTRLAEKDDEDYDLKSEAVEKFWKLRCDCFIHRKYKNNGSNGGIFVVKNPHIQMPYLGLWKQMNAWLDENLNEDGLYVG